MSTLPRLVLNSPQLIAIQVWDAGFLSSDHSLLKEVAAYVSGRNERGDTLFRFQLPYSDRGSFGEDIKIPPKVACQFNHLSKVAFIDFETVRSVPFDHTKIGTTSREERCEVSYHRLGEESSHMDCKKTYTYSLVSMRNFDYLGELDITINYLKNGPAYDLIEDKSRYENFYGLGHFSIKLKNQYGFVETLINSLQETVEQPCLSVARPIPEQTLPAADDTAGLILDIPEPNEPEEAFSNDQQDGERTLPEADDTAQLILDIPEPNEQANLRAQTSRKTVCSQFTKKVVLVAGLVAGTAILLSGFKIQKEE